MAQVREAEVAGQFYPAEPAQLKEMIAQFLQTAPSVPLEGELIALLAPHAGYVFSGGVAGTAYRHLQRESFQTIVVIGTAHYFPVKGVALFNGTAYQTPLGEVPVDQGLVKELTESSSLFQSLPQAHEQEHSVETQLPFLQRTVGSFQLVPMVMGNSDLATCQATGEALARVIQHQQSQGKKVLLIVSSDLSHYPNDQDARTVDSATLNALLTLDARRFSGVNAEWMKKKIPRLSCTYCGESAVTTVLVAAKAMGANRAQLLRYANSSDVPYGEKSRVVGYAAVAWVKQSSSNLPRSAWETVEDELVLSKETQEQLLQMARSAIQEKLSKAGAVRQVSPRFDEPIFNKPAAVFVTLRKKGELRGCIGATEARFPLGFAVGYFACAAAFQDPRFSPVTQEELPELTLEISILSLPKRVRQAEEIVPGRDGVIVKQGGRSGVFLPQVWQETQWTQEMFLDHLCSDKAGLPARAWQDPSTELYTFTVFSFEETD